MHFFLLANASPASSLLVQEMSKVASDLGLTFGLEVINRYESNILNTGHQVCWLCTHRFVHVASEACSSKWAIKAEKPGKHLSIDQKHSTPI